MFRCVCFCLYIYLRASLYIVIYEYLILYLPYFHVSKYVLCCCFLPSTLLLSFFIDMVLIRLTHLPLSWFAFSCVILGWKLAVFMMKGTGNLRPSNIQRVLFIDKYNTQPFQLSNYMKTSKGYHMPLSIFCISAINSCLFKFLIQCDLSTE